MYPYITHAPKTAVNINRDITKNTKKHLIPFLKTTGKSNE